MPCEVIAKRAAGLKDRNGSKRQKSRWELTDRSPVCSGRLKASQRVHAQTRGNASRSVELHQAQRRWHLWPVPVIHLTFSTLPLLSQFIVCQFASLALTSWPRFASDAPIMESLRCRRMWLAVLSAARTCAMWRGRASSGGEKFTGDKWRLTASHLYTARWMLLLSFNTCACIHPTDARMHKITPMGNDYFGVFALWCDYLFFLTISSLLTDAHMHMWEV